MSLWGNTWFDLLDLGLLAFRPHSSEPCSKGPLWRLGASERLSSSVLGRVPASLVPIFSISPLAGGPGPLLSYLTPSSPPLSFLLLPPFLLHPCPCFSSLSTQ